MNKKTVIIVLIILIMLLAMVIFLRAPSGQSNPNSAPEPIIIASTEPSTFPAPKAKPGYESQQFLDQEKQFLQQTPVLQNTPFNNPYFEVEYVDEQHLIIYSETSNKQRDYQAAKDWYTSNGIDISKIQFDYQ